MKVIAIICLVLGFGAVAVGIYHHVETYPNVKAFDQMAQKSGSPADELLAQSYRDAAWTQIYAIWGIAGLGFVLGLVGTLRRSKLAMVGLLLNVAGFVMSMTTIMLSRM